MYNEYGDEEQRPSGQDALSKMREDASKAKNTGKKIKNLANDDNSLKTNKLGRNPFKNRDGNENNVGNNSNNPNSSNQSDGKKSENNSEDLKNGGEAKNTASKEQGASNQAKKGAETAKKGADTAKNVGKAASTSGKAAATGGVSLAVDAAKEKVKGLINALKKLRESAANNEELDPDVKRKIARKIIFWLLIIFIFLGPYIINMLLTAHAIGGMRKSLGDNPSPDDFSFYDNAEDAKDEVEKAFKEAYDLAIKEAKKKCDSDDADWGDSEATLSDNDSGSWEDVYKDSNYIDLCSLVSLIHEGINYDTYDAKKFKKYLKSDDVCKHLYYIDYQKVEYSATEKLVKTKDFYYEIKIYPFSEWNITQIIEKDPYDAIDFTELSEFEDELALTDREDSNTRAYNEDGEATTFDDYMLISRAQTIAILQEMDEDGEINEDLINELNGYNETLKYPIVSITNNVNPYEELEEYEDLDLGQFDTSEWYTEVPIEAEGDGEVAFTLDGWLKMYDGPTESSTSSSYYVNTALARSDIQEDVAQYVSNMNSTSVPKSWSSIEYYEATKDGSARKMHGVKWEIGEGASAMKDDRYLIAVAPGIVFPHYWQMTGGIGNNASWYDYGNKKMDLVVQDKNSGNTYYIPVTTGDSKAHSYPYGVVQTGIQIPGRASQSLVGSDFESDTAIIGFGNAKYYESALDGYSTKLQAKTGYTISNWLSHGVVEWCSPGGGKSTASARVSSLNNKYNLLGIIVY